MSVTFVKTGLLFACLLTGSLAFSQNGVFVSASIDFGGLGGKYRYEQGGSVLKRKWIGNKSKDDVNLLFSPELNVSYYFGDHFGVSFNFKVNDKAAVFHDSRFLAQHGIKGVDFQSNKGRLHADSGNFNPNRNYLSPNIAFHYFFDRELESGFYASAGFGINRYIGKQTRPELSYFHPSSGELLKLQLQYQKIYPYTYVELGYHEYIGNPLREAKGYRTTTKGAMIGMGFRYTFAGKYMQADYTVSQNQAIQYTDHISQGGNYFSVVIRAGGSIFGKQIDRHRQRVYDEETERKQLDKRAREEQIRELHSRKVSVKQELVVHQKDLILSVWDDLKYDQDVITVEWNNSPVLENYTLKTSKKTIKLTLDEKFNQLVVHAISEGKEKPCTVALLVDDGFNKQYVILNSDMSQSESITIRLE